MIHHISIAAHHPLHVSQVLAELLQGQSVPFPGHSGSYVALAFDPQGTMVEVHPFGIAQLPGLGFGRVGIVDGKPGCSERLESGSASRSS